MVCKRRALVNIIDKGTNGSSQHTEVPNEQGFLNARGLETSWSWERAGQEHAGVRGKQEPYRKVFLIKGLV